MTETDIVSTSINRADHAVLVVDDNPATRYSTSRVLRAAGFRTVEAGSGQEALDVAADADVSAVILDVHLPDFDGFEVCRRLRMSPKTAVLPVIHLSATYIEDRHKVAGLNSGADAYITHPAEPPILVATVQALVRARMAEEQVRRSEEKFRAIYARAESGIALIDAEGRFVEANPAMLRMLGRREDEVVGQRVSQFSAAEWQALVRERIEGSPSGEELKREAFSVRQPDNTEVHLEWSMSRHVEPGLRVAVVTNISDRLALEQQRQRLLEREQAARMAAEHHSQTKDDFIAVLSHELRNPLNAMLMGVHMLMRRDVAPEVAKGLQMIEKNANTQARIISDILDVSRLNSGKLTLDREFVDAAAITQSTLEGMKASFSERQLKLLVDTETVTEPVWIDPIRFQQILWNILTNAIKFSDPGSRVVVLLTEDRATLRLVVRDYGRGIKPSFLDQIFDKFAQGSSPENRAHGGLGLGMAIVKHLVDLHGGAVKAESEGLGRGTTITVDFPLMEKAAVPEQAEFSESGKGESEGGELRGQTVLVVEDDPLALEMLSLILRERGVEVMTAKDFDSAVEAFERGNPDFVMSDIGLPGRDGYELIRELRRRELDPTRRSSRRMLAVALTAFGRPEDVDTAIAAGFDLHLSKPIKPHRLVAAMARLVKKGANS